MIVLMMSAPLGDTITPPSSSFRSLPSEPVVQSLRSSVFSLSTFASAPGCHRGSRGHCKNGNEYFLVHNSSLLVVFINNLKIFSMYSLCLPHAYIYILYIYSIATVWIQFAYKQARTKLTLMGPMRMSRKVVFREYG